LRSQISQNYMGTGGFRKRKEISYIHFKFGFRSNNLSKAEARIEGSSTRSNYTIEILLSPNRIHRSSCTCPAGDRCKHIYKVLEYDINFSIINTKSCCISVIHAKSHSCTQSWASTKASEEAKWNESNTSWSCFTHHSCLQIRTQ